MPRQSGLTATSSASERAYHLLRDANRAVIAALDEQSLFDQICRFIVANGYRMAWIGLLQHDAARGIRPVASAGLAQGYLDNIRVTWADDEFGRGPAGYAAREGRIVVNKDFLTNPAVAPWREQAILHGYQSSIAFPLKSESGAAFAVVNIYATEADAFDADEVAKLTELADLLSFGYAAVVGRRLRFDVMEKSVAALAATVESRDPYTAGHLHRVAELAAAIAREMGLDADACRGVRLGALVHDVGKIHVPIDFLTTPKKLSDAEMTVIRTHPEVGYEILKDIPFPWPVAEMVRQHHERWDGSGYPRQLKAADILLGARILAVADVVEAIHSYRPYRPARGLEPALAEIQSGRGRLFDPDVVDACRRLFRERGFLLAGADESH
jgi:putative nucleotidyltransferase with HDIG domain